MHDNIMNLLEDALSVNNFEIKMDKIPYGMSVSILVKP